MFPLITVIVPVYKTEQYLEKCVASICSQTYKNLEIILVDDGSPDNCPAMCDAYARRDSRICVLHKQNGGNASARNAGLDMMHGEYVGFVDSDDWIQPEMYAVLYDRMIGENAQISCCGIERVGPSGHEAFFYENLERKITLDTAPALQELIENICITSSLCDKLYQSSIFDGLRMKNGIIYEDFQMQPYCIARATRITYTAQPLYCYYSAECSTLRSPYSLKHYDEILASREIVALYRESFPSLLPYAQKKDLLICMNAIYRSYSLPEWDEKRGELLAQIKEPLPAEVQALLTKKDFSKLFILRRSVWLYVKLTALYKAVAGKKQKPARCTNRM